MAVVKVKGDQLDVTNVAAVIASDPAATTALAEKFFPLTGGFITGETVLCYDAPCIWYKDPPFISCDTGGLWRSIATGGQLSFNVNTGSFNLAPPFVQPGPPGLNGFIAQGLPFLYPNFVPGYVFAVWGTIGNDGVYRVSQPVQPVGPNTLISVVQTIPNPIGSPGSIADFQFETEMLQMDLTSGVTVPFGITLHANGGLRVQSFFDVFVNIDMDSNKIVDLADGTLSGDALHFGQIGPGGVIQAFDATLDSIALLGTVADRIAYTTGVDTWAETPLTPFAQTLIDDATALAARSTLGVVIGTNVQAFDADLTNIAALTPVEGQVLVRGSSTWTNSVLCKMFEGTGFTAGAIVLTIVTIPIPTDTNMTLTVRGSGRQTGGGAGAVGDAHSRVVHSTVRNVAGITSVVGANSVAHSVTAVLAGVIDVVVSGTDALVQVTGEAMKNVTWTVCVEVTTNP